MAQIDLKYHALLQTILDQGFVYEDVNREGVKRIQIPHYVIEHNFGEGFPAITTKKLYWDSVVGELLWFLKGDTNIKYLVNNGINIWNKDALNYWNSNSNLNKNLKCNSISEFRRKIKEGKYAYGNVGRIYGAQWRDWYKRGKYNEDVGLDQISNLIKGLKENPMGTKHIVTSWNPAELDDMALPPCHWSFEILPYPLYKDEDIKQKLLDNNLPIYGFKLKWHQRSVDVFLGLPFNIASYALLARIIGYMTGMRAEGIIADLSNVHIYEEHLEQVKLQLRRDCRLYDKCEVLHKCKDAFQVFRKNQNLEMLLNNISIDDFKLKGYESFPPIKAEMFAYSKKNNGKE